jgi:hypothetical protein
MALPLSYDHQVVAPLFCFTDDLLGWMADPDFGLHLRDRGLQELEGASEDRVGLGTICLSTDDG